MEISRHPAEFDHEEDFRLAAGEGLFALLQAGALRILGGGNVLATALDGDAVLGGVLFQSGKLKVYSLLILGSGIEPCTSSVHKKTSHIAKVTL